MKILLCIIFISLFLLIGCTSSQQYTSEPTIKEVFYEAPTKFVQEELAAQCTTIVVLETEKGIIKFALFENEIPNNTSNFIKLVEESFFDNTYFHRVVKEISLNIIQGGCPNTKDNNPLNDGHGGLEYCIDDEFNSDLRHIRGAVSMANSGPNTNGSQFFICLDAEFHLNNKHTVIGQVILGMEVADQIEKGDKILHATIE